MKSYQQSKTKDASHAFTLVELMVVIAVIALFASLLIFGVGHLRQKAMITTCQNNLREHNSILAEQLVLQQAERDTTYTAGFGTLSYVPDSGGGMRIYDKGRERIYHEDALKREYSIREIDKYTGPKHLNLGDLGIDDYLESKLPSEAEFCPLVDAKPGYSPLSDTNSPLFKGYGVDTWTDHNFWDGYSEAKSNQFAVDSYINYTTYATNWLSYHPDAVAMIDWNAEEGWRGQLTNTTWQFKNQKKGIVRGTSKGDDWWHTEVGFHHMGGACYVTWSGRAGWVHSNEIDKSFFTP